MIRAVVYCAEWQHDRNAFVLAHPGEPPPSFPYELVEFWDFQRYGLPPNAGGLRDQPLGWLDRCKALDRIWRAWAAYLGGDQGPEWYREHAAEARVAREVKEIVYG
jgi:hypothetical protein